MKKSLTIILFLFVLTQARALENGLARTPPMGWNSWNTFGCNINEKLIKAMADSIVSKGLLAAGYEYVIIDDCWQTGRDANHIIVADKSRFPSGIENLADYIHSKGLKFGLYTCAGPNTCAGRPGSFGYEELDAKTWAQWGVDYVKVDWCFNAGLDGKTAYTKMSKALEASGRPILLSICEWGENKPWEWAQNVGNMWRTTYDIVNCFDCNQFLNMGWSKIIELNVDLAPFAGPGHWNDPDMLEVGNSGLTYVESLTHFVMWNMMASPLIAGNDIRIMNDSTKNILTAPEILAINQDTMGVQGTRIKNANNLQVWQKPLSDGSIAVAFYNKSASTANISITLNELGLKADSAFVRDLWARTDLGFFKTSITKSVVSHGVAIFKVKGLKQPVTVLTLNTKKLTLQVGNNGMISVIVNPATTLLKLSSSNNEIIQTGAIGAKSYYVSAIKPGTGTIIVSTLDGSVADTCVVEILPTSLPSGWKFDDISDFKGSATYNSGVFSLTASGADIWNSADQLGLVSLDTTGNISISAKLNSMQNTDPWAKVGLMIREDGYSKSSYVMLAATPGNGFWAQWRPNYGGGSTNTKIGAFTLPVYLKLSKINNTFKFYKSADGVKWDSIGVYTDADAFSKKYKIGFGVSAHNNLVTNTAVFSNVEIGTPGLTSVEEIKKTNLNIYPNPVKDFLTVITNKPNTTYNLVNLNGQIMLEGVLLNENCTVDCRKLQNGIYILNVMEKTNVVHKMILKSH